MYTEAGIDALAKAVADAGRARPLDVHLKVDTGMHRVGCIPDDARRAGERIVAARDELALAGVLHAPRGRRRARRTRTPPSSSPRFDAVLDALGAAGLRPPLVHAANSAGLLACADARYDLVRVGIAAYGLPPAPGLADGGPVALRRHCRCTPGSRW